MLNMAVYATKNRGGSPYKPPPAVHLTSKASRRNTPIYPRDWITPSLPNRSLMPSQSDQSEGLRKERSEDETL